MYLDGQNYLVTSKNNSVTYQVQVGNATAQTLTDITITRWNGDGNESATLSGTIGIEFPYDGTNLTSSTISSCNLKNFQSNGIQINHYTETLTIIDNTITNCVYSAISFIEWCKDSRITNNILNCTNPFYGDDGVYDSFEGTILNLTPQSGTRIIGSGLLGGNYYCNEEGTGFSQTEPDNDLDGFTDATYTFDNSNGNTLTDYYPLSLGYQYQNEFYSNLVWFIIFLLLTLGSGFFLYKLSRSKWGFFIGIFSGLIIVYVMVPNMANYLWAFILIGAALVIAVFANEAHGGTYT